jgi:hypothetical protein
MILNIVTQLYPFININNEDYNAKKERGQLFIQEILIILYRADICL